MADNRTRRDGAHSLTGKRKAPLAWLPWVGLLLLLLLAALIVLLVRNVGDDGDEPGIDVRDDPAAASADGADVTAVTDPGAAGGVAPGVTAAPTATAGAGAANTAAPVPANQPSNGTATTAAGADAGGVPAAAAGALTAGGQPLLPVPAGGLGSLAGQAVTGTGVPVESVVADEGFWVGTNSTDRVFVYLTPEARTTSGESPFQVQAGQRVDITGTVIALDGTPDALGVEPAEGAEQLTQQGHLVEATQLTLS